MKYSSKVEWKTLFTRAQRRIPISPGDWEAPSSPGARTTTASKARRKWGEGAAQRGLRQTRKATLDLSEVRSPTSFLNPINLFHGRLLNTLQVGALAAVAQHHVDAQRRRSRRFQGGSSIFREANFYMHFIDLPVLCVQICILVRMFDTYYFWTDTFSTTLRSGWRMWLLPSHFSSARAESAWAAAAGSAFSTLPRAPSSSRLAEAAARMVSKTSASSPPPPGFPTHPKIFPRGTIR